MADPGDGGRRDGLVGTGAGTANGDRMGVGKMAVIATAAIKSYCLNRGLNGLSGHGIELRPRLFPVAPQGRYLIAKGF